MKKPFLFLSAWCLSLAFLPFMTGCGSDDVVAKGTVTFDGTPIEMGTITFMPEGGNGPTVGGPITNGKYSVTMTPAKYRVQIIGTKIVGTIIAPEGEVDAGQEREITEQYVPEKYNRKTTLAADLAKSDKSLNFELTKD